MGKNRSKAHLLAVGAAQLDIVARPGASENGGTVTVEVGGTAANCAANWAQAASEMGFCSRLLTNAGSGPMAQMVLGHLRSDGVEVIEDGPGDLPAAAFSVHLDEDGKIMHSVECVPVSRCSFAPEVLRRAFEGARWVVADANLSKGQIEALSLQARARRVPLWLDCVSEKKAAKAAKMAGKVDGVCASAQEARLILQAMGCGRGDLRGAGGGGGRGRFGAADKYDYANTYAGMRLAQGQGQGSAGLLELAAGLAEAMGCCALVAGKPAQGAAFAESGGSSFCAGGQSEGGDAALGYRDVLLSMFCAGLAQGIGYREALDFAQAKACGMKAGQGHNLGSGDPITKAMRELERKAHCDPLTGLANRAGAMAELGQRRGAGPGEGLGVLLVDIDHFKSVNDELGHDAGDAALVNVAMALRRSLREGDVACRWGGEEFVCFARAQSMQELCEIAERLRAQVERSHILPQRRVTVSVGVWLAGDSEGLESALSKADKGLYEAKRTGRNRVCAGG